MDSKNRLRGAPGDRSRSKERPFADLGRIFLRAGEIVLPAASPATCFVFFSVLFVRFQHQSFSPLPEKSIRLIHPPPFALSPPGLLSVQRVDSRARSVAAVVEIGAIRRSGRKGATAGGSVGNLLPSKRAKNAEEEQERSKTLVPENWILITILVCVSVPFSHLVTRREKRLAQALCRTQARSCSGSVGPLLRKEQIGGRRRTLTEPGGRRRGGILILALSPDSKRVSCFIEQRHSSPPHCTLPFLDSGSGITRFTALSRWISSVHRLNASFLYLIVLGYVSFTGKLIACRF